MGDEEKEVTESPPETEETEEKEVVEEPSKEESPPVVQPEPSVKAPEPVVVASINVKIKDNLVCDIEFSGAIDGLQLQAAINQIKLAYGTGYAAHRRAEEVKNLEANRAKVLKERAEAADKAEKVRVESLKEKERKEAQARKEAEEAANKLAEQRLLINKRKEEERRKVLGSSLTKREEALASLDVSDAKVIADLKKEGVLPKSENEK